ncbi:TPA: MFS transporter [Enterococcus faecalis]|uniref:MFS transporter n=1 Tax=Enterococcus faecalis TaxID=1351 RepID=UPI000CF715CB|nr:MFS transporter [Enterococcus faecalis]PQC11818.1 MFS transporter [Enterococcus faecalis]HAP3814274.1 MFS transporter [Enterococcus faecalis]HAP3825345.1 MFS transporter [Enterococcus faecalis]
MKSKIPKKLIFFMSLTCGLSIACLYYIQPLEQLISQDLAISESQIGIAPMLSQLGYAFGLLFLVPLGDKLIKKNLIITMLLIVSLVLLIISQTHNYSLFVILMFLIGATAIIPQLIIPFAGELATDKERGKVLGIVTGGLLIGILLSRTYSGIVGAIYGWRIVYLTGGFMCISLTILVLLTFPKNKPNNELSYLELLNSLPNLLISQSKLRKSAINGFLIFGAFNIFWSTLIFYMSSNVYNLGSKEVGYMGLVGVIGAVASVFMGNIVDKKGANFGINLGTFCVCFSFIFMLLMGNKLFFLVFSTILLDFGAQSAQISNQTIVQGLSDEYRSRNNTLFMFFYFTGGALGSFLGTLSWQTFGWTGICILGILFSSLALLNQLIFKIYI